MVPFSAAVEFTALVNGKEIDTLNVNIYYSW